MKHTLFNTILLATGFILSPLSWWNDLLVNVPLSYLLSWPFSIIDQRLFLPAFVVAYWLTNLLGFLMMHWGGHGLLVNRTVALSVRKSLLVSLIYTLIIVLMVWQEWLPSPASFVSY